MPLFSVAIVTLNEEENLPRTLASVAALVGDSREQVVVVDSGSTDRTVAIAREFGATVIERPWPGFAAQKNFAMAQCTGDWILSLDADEEVSPELQQQMRLVLASQPPTDAFYLKRRNLFLGRWMKYGGYYPDPKLRLFRRRTAKFETPLQFEERPVHEVIAFDGAAATLDFDLIHHAYPTLTNYLEHMDRYSSLGAQILVDKGRVSSSLATFLWHVFWVPRLGFLWNYVFRLGFLDGREGMLLHLYHATYTSWKYAKAWEKARRVSDGVSTPGRRG
jgi:glycosyltransferase involved in cell wall biosynthesis